MNATLQNIPIPQILTDSNGDGIAIISADEYNYLLSATEIYEDMMDIQEFEAAKRQEKAPLDIVLKRLEEKRKKNGIS